MDRDWIDLKAALLWILEPGLVAAHPELLDASFGPVPLHQQGHPLLDDWNEKRDFDGAWQRLRLAIADGEVGARGYEVLPTHPRRPRESTVKSPMLSEEEEEDEGDYNPRPKTLLTGAHISRLVLDRTRAHYLVGSTAPLVSGPVWNNVEVNVKDLAAVFDPKMEEEAELTDGKEPRTSAELQTDSEIIEAWRACWVAVEQGKRFPVKVQDAAIKKELGWENGPHPSRIRAAFASLNIERKKRPT